MLDRRPMLSDTPLPNLPPQGGKESDFANGTMCPPPPLWGRVGEGGVRGPCRAMTDHFETGTFAGTELACIRGERLLFRGLGFVLEPGAALVLTGPNGSGKSSLLRLLAGLLPPAAGDLTWNTRPVNEDREAQRTRLLYLGH